MYFQPSQTVAIIGAGPFGLSIAAHLRSRGIDFRIFGRPMYRWRCQMPKGMFLKSEGCASSLSDPAGCFTLARYCAENRLPYGEWGTPVSLESFTGYALAFQQEFAPGVEEVMVTAVETSDNGFELQLANDSATRAAKVIIATGLEYTAQIPPVLARLPRELVSHSSHHNDLSRFRGKDVTVIGAGQSALESAALLSEEGASVRVLVRKPSLVWSPTPKVVRRPRYERMRYPRTGLGQGLKVWVYCSAPMLFRYLPQRVRFNIVKSTLGPGGAWWLKERVDGRFEILTGYSVQNAETRGARALLRTTGPEGRGMDVTTDHVIAATGYRFELQRLPFLSKNLKSRVRTEEQTPVLSPTFESSVSGMYFTGLASANYFGPVMRFIEGTHYTARTISSHIAAAWRRNGSGPAFRPRTFSKCRDSE
jgi:cation diffusion facilitator CzcD-associated flavoprotein CzcO